MSPKKILAVASGIAITFFLLLISRNMFSLNANSKETKNIYSEMDQADKEAGALLQPVGAQNTVNAELANDIPTELSSSTPTSQSQ